MVLTAEIAHILVKRLGRRLKRTCRGVTLEGIYSFIDDGGSEGSCSKDSCACHSVTVLMPPPWEDA